MENAVTIGQANKTIRESADLNTHASVSTDNQFSRFVQFVEKLPAAPDEIAYMSDAQMRGLLGERPV